MRRPTAEDGPALHDLVAACPPLDRNSRYCNLLQVGHFAATAVVAEIDGNLVGSLTGYLKPGDAATLFVWQVAVHESARGCSLATRMMQEVVGRDVCRDVRFMETTINPDNAASWRAFDKFADAVGAPCERESLFCRERHFAGHHADEVLLRIGPFQTG